MRNAPECFLFSPTTSMSMRTFSPKQRFCKCMTQKKEISWQKMTMHFGIYKNLLSMPGKLLRLACTDVLHYSCISWVAVLSSCLRCLLLLKANKNVKQLQTTDQRPTVRQSIYILDWVALTYQTKASFRDHFSIGAESRKTRPWLYSNMFLLPDVAFKRLINFNTESERIASKGQLK